MSNRRGLPEPRGGTKNIQGDTPARRGWPLLPVAFSWCWLGRLARGLNLRRGDPEFVEGDGAGSLRLSKLSGGTTLTGLWLNAFCARATRGETDLDAHLVLVDRRGRDLVHTLSAERLGPGGGGDTSGMGDEVGAYVVSSSSLRIDLFRQLQPNTGYSGATTSLGGGRCRVGTYIDSENSFGATLRSDFTCVVTHVSSGGGVGRRATVRLRIHPRLQIFVTRSTTLGLTTLPMTLRGSSSMVSISLGIL